MDKAMNFSGQVKSLANLHHCFLFNPLSANPEKWSNTVKQIVGNLPTICLSVFDHFMNLALKGLSKNKANQKIRLRKSCFESMLL